MDITTEFRSHWVSIDGTRYPTLRDDAGARRSLRPILNLDEVRAWLMIATSDATRGLGFPGAEHDSCVFYMRGFLSTDTHPGERERLAPLICDELTDDVPRYHRAWAREFIEMRNRWPGVDGLPVVAV